MPQPTGDAKGINYSQRDDRSRMLWNSQLGKANPWEHRGQNLDAEDEAPPQAPVEQAAAPQPPTMIPQQDQLRLHRPAKDVENPFERLIEHQLHLKLPDQEPTV